jgi:hypothetical protein
MGVVEGGRGIRRSGRVWAVTRKSLFGSRGVEGTLSDGCLRWSVRQVRKHLEKVVECWGC